MQWDKKFNTLTLDVVKKILYSVSIYNELTISENDRTKIVLHRSAGRHEELRTNKQWEVKNEIVFTWSDEWNFYSIIAVEYKKIKGMK